MKVEDLILPLCDVQLEFSFSILNSTFLRAATYGNYVTYTLLFHRLSCIIWSLFASACLRLAVSFLPVSTARVSD